MANKAQVGLLMMGALARTLGRRLMGKPMHPAWDVKTETLFMFMKANNLRLHTLDWQAMRAENEAMVQPSPVLSRVRVEAVDVDGVPAEWVQPLDAPPGLPVLLYLHGGCYIMGSARTHGELVARMALGGFKVLALNYRLAPEHPLPAALEDAGKAWRWLLAQGIKPAEALVGGDSAGGGLAVSMMVQARDAGVALPAGALLICPWVDMTARGGSLQSNEKFDWAEPWMFEKWAQVASPNIPHGDARVSPSFAALAGLPPLCIHSGGAEMLQDQVVAFAAKARDAGVKVEHLEAPGMVHDWVLFAGMLPAAAQAVDALVKSGKAMVG